MPDHPIPSTIRTASARLLRLAWLPLLVLFALLPGLVRAGTLPGELPVLVGRLNVEAGVVQLQDRDTGRWDEPGEPGALRNWPVAEGDRLRLRGRDARAELRIGSTTLRLGAGAELWLQQLDAQAVLLQLQDGTLALRLAAVDGDAFGPVELQTREGRWLPRRPGHYRFDRERDATQASVWRGELQFQGFDSALTIPEGRRADLWLDAPDALRRSATRYAWAAVERDGFADWVARDERLDDAPQAARHVPPGISGWQDLDRHGDWVADSEHGPLWLPRVLAPGWAPFQVGRWAWVAPWGWTWIDAAPWGFAPFHYGSWVRFDSRWAWAPGRHQPHWHGHRDPRVRYAPALGAWIGGPSVGVTVQIGGRHRPPPPRVVVPSVPVVVVRPEHHHHHHRPPPPLVVGPVRPGHAHDGRPGDRPGEWHGNRPRDWRDDPRGAPRLGDGLRGNGAHDGARQRDGRGDSRDDGRGDGRGDGRDDGRGERRGDGRGDARVDGRHDGRPAEREAPQPLRPLPAAPAVAPGAATVAPVTARPAAPAQPPVPVATPEPPRMAVPRPPLRPPQAGAPERPDRADRGERPERTERAERPVHQERAERPEPPERPDRLERPERQGRAEQQARPERPDRIDRPERGADRAPGAPRADAPRGAPGRVNDRDLAR